MPAGHDISARGGAELVAAVAADKTLATTTPAAQADLTVACGTGTYVYNYFLILQSAATTTGHKFDVNFTGSVGIFANNIRWVTAATTASDDVPDQDHVAAPGGVVSAFTARAVGTTGTGQTTDVDTINADVLYIVEGIMTVTAAGNLELYWGCDAAANATMKAGSSLILWKTG